MPAWLHLLSLLHRLNWTETTATLREGAQSTQRSVNPSRWLISNTDSCFDHAFSALIYINRACNKYINKTSSDRRYMPHVTFPQDAYRANTMPICIYYICFKKKKTKTKSVNGRWFLLPWKPLNDINRCGSGVLFFFSLIQNHLIHE